jgi:hypothetical protein
MKKEFPGGLQIGVVIGGDINDPAPDLSGNFKVVSPTEHNPANFPQDQLPFATIIEPATKSSQSEFGGVPDPSSMVVTLKTTGANPVVLGRFRDFANPMQSAPGNNNIMQLMQGQYGMWTNPLGMLAPPRGGIEEKTEGGVPVRRRKQTQEYNPSMIQGLPNHAALWNMAGHRWPQIKEIETATTHFNQVLTSDMLGKLPGQIGSLASLLGSLSGNQKKKIKESVPEDVYNALESMSNMMPGISGGSSVLTDFRVNPEAWANNATDILCQCTTISDLQEAFIELETNPDLRGLDEYDELEIVMEGPFGNTTLNVAASGATSSKQSDGFQKAMQAFSSFLQSAEAASVNKGQNMFGPSAKTINDMIQRVAPETQAKIKQTLEDVNKNQDHHKFAELFQTGGAKALTDTILSSLG